MNTPQPSPKPHVVWLEGVLDYFNALPPGEPGERLKIGIAVGRQIIGLYLVEMIIKYALDDFKKPYARNRNLRELFSTLPRQQRRAVERKYETILPASVLQAWDFASSVTSFLTYLGDDAMNDSRYFSERFREQGISIVFMPRLFRPLIYALFMVLHNYPDGPPTPERRQDTRFVSFEGSLEDRATTRRQDGERDHAGTKPNKFWVEGLLHYFNLPPPHESGDPRNFGFHVGQRVIGLYLVEIVLKTTLDEFNLPYRNTHNLYSLFKRLPQSRQLAIGKKYREILSQHVSSTLRYADSAEALLQQSGRDPITDTRYFWEKTDKRVLSLSPSPLKPLVYALLIEFYEYPPDGPIVAV